MLPDYVDAILNLLLVFEVLWESSLLGRQINAPLMNNPFAKLGRHSPSLES